MKSELPLESIVLGLVVVGIFASVFFFTQLAPKSTDKDISGVRVIATGDALAQLQGIVQRNNPVIFEMDLPSFENNSGNTALVFSTAQIASNLARFGRKAYVYGSVNGNASINCVNETNHCSGAVVLMKIGTCNCMRINDTSVVIEGTEAFHADQKTLQVLSGLFGQAASRAAPSVQIQAAPSNAATPSASNTPVLANLTFPPAGVPAALPNATLPPA